MIHTTDRVLVSDLREHVGRTVSVSGWVHTLRLLSKVQFVVVWDHTGMVQVTHQRGGAGDEIEAALQQLTPESAVRISGRVADNPIVKLHGLEIIPETVEVLNRAETPQPIDEHTGLEHRLDWRFLDVRRRPAAQLQFALCRPRSSRGCASTPTGRAAPRCTRRS